MRILSVLEVRIELQLSSAEIVEEYIESMLKYLKNEIEEIFFRICSIFENNRIPMSIDKRLINRGGSTWRGNPTCKIEFF
tara:strand:+ start:112 stop:351 length:240 start_codon:yes stop_codon:yes gene_type:complete